MAVLRGILQCVDAHHDSGRRMREELAGVGVDDDGAGADDDAERHLVFRERVVDGALE